MWCRLPSVWRAGAWCAGDAHLGLAAEITPCNATNPGNHRRGVSWTDPPPGSGGVWKRVRRAREERKAGKFLKYFIFLPS